MGSVVNERNVSAEYLSVLKALMRSTIWTETSSGVGTALRREMIRVYPAMMGSIFFRTSGSVREMLSRAIIASFCDQVYAVSTCATASFQEVSAAVSELATPVVLTS